MGACLSCFGGGGTAPPRDRTDQNATSYYSPVAPVADRNNLNKNKTQRKETWARTGMVSVRDASLKELPKEALELGTGVKVLDATNNAIGFVPASISGLGNITRLVLAQNRITTLPAEIGQLFALKVLILEANVIASLPEDLGNLLKLEKLNLARNHLRSLPTSMGSLTNLKELNVSNNLITALPPTLGQCVSLESLTANNNALLELPEELGALKRIKEIVLDSNGIATVPSDIFTGCSSLQTLSLHANPVSEGMLMQVPGYTTFRERVKAKFDKQIGTGVLLNKTGLDDGLDHTSSKTQIVVPHT